MPIVWKSGYIPGGQVTNMPSAFGGSDKELVINTWHRQIKFRRFTVRGCYPVYIVTAAEGLYDNSTKYFDETKAKSFEFDDENKAMKKFMDMAFNGLAT